MPNSPVEEPAAIKQQTFVGGVVDFLPKNLIPDNAAARLENVETHMHGTLRRRGGLRLQYTHVNTSTDQPFLLKTFSGVRGLNPFEVAVYANAPSTAKTTIDHGTEGAQSFAFPSGYAFDERGDVFKLLDRIYFGRAGQQPLYWQTDSVALAQEVPAPGFSESTIPPVVTGIFFQGRGWATGDPTAADLVYFSSAQGTTGNEESSRNPLSWDRHFQAFRMETGNVTAIVPFRNQALVIFTDHGIESLEPNCCEILNTHRLTLNRSTGCPYRHTIAIAGEDIYFMDQEGHIRSLSQTELDENRGVTNAPLSLAINNVIERQTKNRLHWARGGYARGVYWIWMPTDQSQYAQEGWGYSIRDQAWIGPYFLMRDQIGGTLAPATVGGITHHRFEGDTDRTYFLVKTQATSIKTYIGLEARDLTDDGVTIPVIMESKNYQFNESVRETWNHIEHDFRFIISPGDATVSMLIEVRSDEAGWNTATTKTVTPDAGPNLPVALPFYLTPYTRQTLKTSLTGITPRSYGIQQQLTIRDPTTTWEILGTLLTGWPDNPEYAV